MRQKLPIIVVAVMLLLAGCTGGDELSPIGPDETDPVGGGLFEEAPPQNPWQTDEITVNVVDKPDDRDYAPLITESIEYWNANMSMLNWEGEFVYDPTAENPDVPVRIVEDIEQCGLEYDENTVGCAPIYTTTGEALDRGNEPVRIMTSLNDSSTINVGIHEFGHALGLTHNDTADWALMNESIGTATVAQPNATERENPFEQETIRVYYNDTNTDRLNEYIRGEFDSVWDYHNAGESNIVPSTVTFQQTTDESQADIEIKIVSDLDDGVSTVRWYGYDPHADGALETYDTATVQIDEEVNQDNMAWHVGSWTTYLFSS